MASEFEFPSPPPPESGRLRYDVFLSFRGKDTRHKFTSHLYRALTDHGINVFLDAVELPRGEEISSELQLAIRTSWFAVVILSRNYAESKWCLQELEEIMKWKLATGQVVLPVFYGVKPSDVRAQLGPFEKPFAGHESTFGPEKVARWREALKEAGKLSGVIIGKRDDEAAKLEEIVRFIQVGLDAETRLHVASFPVGLDSRLAELPSRLSDSSNGVYFLGIVGMAGVGKTSLAKAIYNRLILNFKYASFLSNVGGKSKVLDYIVHLQLQLLDDIAYYKKLPGRIINVDEGIDVLRHTLSLKKVLVVLDDVRDVDQIRKLAGGHDWFGPGSRIIVTTRDPDLLKAIHVDDVYDVKRLNEHESLQLFCGHVFRELSPRPTEDEEEEFMRLSEQVLSYCKGIPLALETLGGSLAGKSTEYWKNTIDQLETIPDERIQARLEISYDSLGNDRLQQLFLDIACFFVGWDKDYVVMVLDACGLFAKKGIEDLIGKCLVQVDEQNKLQMHDLTRDMGKEIVRKQSPNDPGERSRLWRRDDILAVLRSHLGTKRIEGIVMNSSDSSVAYASAKAFKKMKRLRLLQLDNLELHGEYGLISKELRFLYWHNFLNKFIPDDLYLEQLVAIDMQHNTLIEVFQDNQVLWNLKSLNLSHSKSLTKTPNFSKFPNLEKLTLECCTELVYVHPSIGILQRLTSMNFKRCTKLTLEKFPESIRALKSLENFCFSSSSNVFSFVETSMLQVQKRTPRPLQTQIHSQWTIPMFGVTTLKTLKLKRSIVDGGAIPADIISSLTYLEYLDLSQNDFVSLPDTISHLPKLKSLKLYDCRNLKVLPDMPPSLLCLSAIRCSFLRRMSMPHFGYGTSLFLANCQQLRAIDGLQRRDRKGSIHLEQCDGLEPEFKEFLLKDWCGDGRSNVFLLGSNIPEWFHYRTSGSSLSITIPPSWYGNLKDLTVCVIYSCNGGRSYPNPTVDIHPLNISYSSAETNNKFDLTIKDHMWVFHLPESFFLGRLDSVNELTLSADFGIGWTVKGLGAYFPNQVRNPDEYGEEREAEGEEDAASLNDALKEEIQDLKVLTGQVFPNGGPMMNNQPMHTLHAAHQFLQLQIQSYKQQQQQQQQQLHQPQLQQEQQQQLRGSMAASSAHKDSNAAADNPSAMKD